MAKKSKVEGPLTPFEKTTPLKRLKLLVTIVNQNQADFYLALLKKHECGVQIHLHGHGTATSQISDLMGVGETDKDILIGVIREDQVSPILEEIKRRFSLSRKAKGVAFTITLTSVVGVSIYKFLANSTDLIGGK